MLQPLLTTLSGAEYDRVIQTIDETIALVEISRLLAPNEPHASNAAIVKDALALNNHSFACRLA